MEFKIGLAGRVIGISSIYDEIYDLCKDYYIDEIDEREDFHVTVSPEDIQFEHEKSIREAVFEGTPIYEYENSYYETLAVYRKIAVEMLKYNTWLMHGAVVGVRSVGGENDAAVIGVRGAGGKNDAAVLFTAQSGVGKTTHIKLWLENIPGAFVINGDKPLIRYISNEFSYLSSEGEHFDVCGTPWAGKEGFQTNEIMPLKAICFLERGDKNIIEKVSFEEVYPMLLQQTYRPTDPQAMEKTMRLIVELGKTVPFYRMKATMDSEAARAAYEGIFCIE